jgi:uncharacterized protein (TIGR03435 family)
MTRCALVNIPVICVLLWSLPRAQVVQAQTFEVASVKAGDANSGHVGIHSENSGRFTTTNTTLRVLVGYAYGINNHQISGGPKWLDSEAFSIEAKPSTGTFQAGPETEGKILSMLQSLLADRFTLSLHWEMTEQIVYELVIAKGGSKLKATDSSNESQNLDGERGHLMGKGVPIPALAKNLSRQLGRTVIDKTGLSGRYDFKLAYTPETRDGVFGGAITAQDTRSPDPDDVSIFTALQEQLGLKLESTKGSVKMLIIDHAEKPDAN